MDKNREPRRGVTMAVSNGLSRRRQRSNSLRDSPEDDGILELQETVRLRDRKKDRDRDRDRERERDRDRERDRERDRDRFGRSSKRRRNDKFMYGNMREDGGDDTSEESVNDDEDDDDDGGGGGSSSSMRMLPPNPSTTSSSMLNHHINHHHHHNGINHNSSSNNYNNNHSRKSFPPPAKVFRSTPPPVTSTSTATTMTNSTWKAADEMMSVSVPRKARSASTKRSHEWASSGGAGGVGGGGGVGGEQINMQASSSPVRPSVPIAMATPAPASPPPPNVSVRKKMKPNGPKLRPAKSSSNKSSSLAQDEIEIEIAEVLYGMMRQPQGPTKQEIVGSDSVPRETDNNNNLKPSSDAKSRASSPVANSPSTLPPSSSTLPTNSSSSTAPMCAVAQKRKRPRLVKYDDENPSMFTAHNSPISSVTMKTEMDQSAKTAPSSKFENNSGTAVMKNGSISYDLGSSQAFVPQMESKKPETNSLLADLKGLNEESDSGKRDMCGAKVEPQSPKKESAAVGFRLDDDRPDNMALSKAISTPTEAEIQREEKFHIDLMAPPPFRSSPERDSEIDSVAVDLRPRLKPALKEDEKEVKMVKDDASIEAEEKKTKTVAEESESQKPIVDKQRNVDLHLDLEKCDRDGGSGSLSGSKVHPHVQKQPTVAEKTAQSNSLPFPLPMAGWPAGGLPPLGYMAPLQGVVSMDGSSVSSAAIQPPHLLFSQSRPKRCATHCFMAQNIRNHQLFTRRSPFWPTAAGSASLYGAKAACNLNVVPPTELHGPFMGRGVNTVPDKGQSLAVFPSLAGKDSKSSQPATIMDATQKNQILLQQVLPPGAPSNILHAPAFIFPLSQQQASSAVRPGSVKSPPVASNIASSSASNSASVSTSTAAGAAATAVSFNYSNMPGNDPQYLAILQNNAYPFPISAHVGASPAYRGTHAQAMPFFNGTFYSSQMLHPSQLQQQQQQQQQQQLPTQSQPSQGPPHTSISSCSSSSQKHLQNQQQRPNSSGINGSSATLQGFPTPKNQAQLQMPKRQQQNQQIPYQARQLEGEIGGEESPSTADSRVSRANMNIYSQNFSMPLHQPNFALVTTAPTGTSEKKPQQQSSKAGLESMAPQTFAMTFTSINGAATAPGFDISSIAQNPILQSLPEAARQGYQIIAASQAATQKKNYRASEEGKIGPNDASSVEEERKSMSGKPPSTVGQSIAFSRQDLSDAQVSAMMGKTVLDSSTRTLNLGTVPTRSNVSLLPASMSNSNTSVARQQLQLSQQHPQQMKQQQLAAAAQRSKTPATSNGSVYSDPLPASSVTAKFPNALSVFPQNLVQSSSGHSPSQQWKNSGRTSTSQATSQSLASSTPSSLKNLPQQQGRTHHGHTQISIAANAKSSSVQVQPSASNNQTASPPMMVGSPTTSSISKTSAGGSPRTTTTTSTSNKGGQTSLSSQQAKNSLSMPSRKSSPVPSILGNPNISISSTTGAKQQMSLQQQQQQQQLLSKHAFQQPQLLFSNVAAYMQAQAQQHAASTTSSASAASSVFTQRHRDHQQPQQQPGSSATSSSGMLSWCPPVSHSNLGTSDPAKAIAAASNMKGLSSQGLVHNGQFAASQSSGKQHQNVPPVFPYVPAVPSPVQGKPSEQKQPGGE